MEIRDENYFIVHGWIKNQLGLKGTKRDIYAIIYGFTQDGENEFKGSLNYFVEWLDVSRQTVIKCLQELTESGLLIKRTEIINGVQFNRYKASLPLVKNFDGGSQKNILGGSQKILPNKDNIINNNKKIIKENSINIIKEIVDYLNEKANTKYRYSSSKTQTLINARLKEGFTLEDFKIVIYNRVSNWKGTNMEQYLRPETLFGTKFESYLNSKTTTNKNNNINKENKTNGEVEDYDFYKQWQ